MVDVDAKRAEAKGLRGVSYDARMDRFTAEIYVGGVRRWLGSHTTAQAASDAHSAAAAEREPVVKASAFQTLYAEFRSKYGGARADPPAGAELEYDGQKFVYRGVTWRKTKGAKSFAYMVWESKCKTCGAVYRTMSPAPVSVAKGVTRNCPEHVKASRFGKAKPSAAGKGRPDPSETIGARLVAAVEQFGLLYDRVPLDELLGPLRGRGFHIPEVGTLRRVLARRIETEVAEGYEAPGFSLVEDEVVFS